jgi:hypothetical protein
LGGNNNFGSSETYCNVNSDCRILKLYKSQNYLLEARLFWDSDSMDYKKIMGILFTFWERIQGPTNGTKMQQSSKTKKT